MNNQDILAARVGAVLRCRSLEGNDHAVRPAPCTASHQHTHHCPGYSWTVAKCRFRLRSLSAQIHRPTPQRLTFRRAWRFHRRCDRNAVYDDADHAHRQGKRDALFRQAASQTEGAHGAAFADPSVFVRQRTDCCRMSDQPAPCIRNSRISQACRCSICGGLWRRRMLDGRFRRSNAIKRRFS